MIKYKTSDLVKKAAQLADLENTDFISWNENQTLLNDQYQTVMQRCIDAGEQLNVNTIYSTTGQSIALPDDFYSLRSITLYYNGMISMVPRHTISMSYHDLSYEIRNNILYLYGGQSQKVKIDYYVSFPTISYPNENTSIDWTPATGFTVVQANSKYVVENNNLVYNVYDIQTHTLINTFTQTFASLNNLLHGEYLCLETLDGWNICSIVAGTTSTIVGKLIIDQSGDIGYTNEAFDILDINGIKVGKLKGSEYPQRIIAIYTNIEKNKEYAYYSNGDLLIGDSTYTIDNIELTTIDEEGLYFIIGKTLYKYNLLTGVAESIKTYALVPGSFTGLNGSTGYGVAAYSNNIITIYSYLQDTKLEVPSNILWNIMAYQLAIQYKVKQGADITLLSTTYSSMSNTFFDSMKQDMYQPCRINNIYK